MCRWVGAPKTQTPRCPSSLNESRDTPAPTNQDAFREERCLPARSLLHCPVPVSPTGDEHQHFLEVRSRSLNYSNMVQVSLERAELTGRQGSL